MPHTRRLSPRPPDPDLPGGFPSRSAPAPSQWQRRVRAPRGPRGAGGRAGPGVSPHLTLGASTARRRGPPLASPAAGTYLDDADFVPAPSGMYIDELRGMRAQPDEAVREREEVVDVPAPDEIDSDVIRWGQALAKSLAGLDEAEREREDALAKGQGVAVPVYVMLPLDAIWLEEKNGTPVGQLWPELSRDKLRGVHSYVKRCRALQVGLKAIKAAGVEGVMVDVWWGIVEREAPGKYDFKAYKELFSIIDAAGLKIQAVMSFHAAGGNVGDTCKVPLPAWVLDIGERDPDIFFTDRAGVRNRESLSFGVDDVPLLDGATPIRVYRRFMERFCDEFEDMFGTTITEITVGMGPAGELRYPAYPEGDGRWRFPGVGEFQCYDAYLLRKLRAEAKKIGRPEWGHGGPHDAGHYNSKAWETGFFVSEGGSWDSPYGDFFLRWYSGVLLDHCDRMLHAARDVFGRRNFPMEVSGVREAEAGPSGDGVVLYEFAPACHLGVKLPGVHWWFKAKAHAAELTAGFYNTRDRDGYRPVFEMLRSHSARMSFTCVEMRDREHAPEARCSPEGLLKQILDLGEEYDVKVAGENALQRYDYEAFDRIIQSAFGQAAQKNSLAQLTFLRMGDLMFDHWDAFSNFILRMRRIPLERAKAAQAARGGGAEREAGA